MNGAWGFEAEATAVLARDLPEAGVTDPYASPDPSPHVVLDGVLGLADLRAVAAAWPAPDWPGWVRYDDAAQRKYASDLLTALPAALGVALTRLATLPVGRWLGLPDSVPDLALWGAGLHESRPGDGLGLHLDADGHARLGVRRAWSATLFVHEHWEPGWGGEFVLCDAARRDAVTVAPLPGRLVAFDARHAPHRVKPVAAHARPRRSLAVFGYLPEPAGRRRPRAEFLKRGGADP